MPRPLITLASLTLTLGAVACGGSQPDPQCAPGQFFDPNRQTCVTSGVGAECPPGLFFNGTQCVASGAQCPPGQTWNGTACQGATPTCPAGTTPGPNGACVGTGGGGGSTGGSVAANGCSGPAQAMDEAIHGGHLFQAAAAQHVPAGAQPVGSIVAGNFQEGQCLELPIQVEAGKCYTVVGASLGEVGDLDLELIPNIGVPGVPTAPMAQDQTDGPQAVLGGKPNCWTAMLPGPMKLVVRVARGQGMAAAQIYAR